MTEFMGYGKAASFLAEVVSSDSESEALSYCYPGAMLDAWVPGVAVRVVPSSGAEWLGYFMQGKESPNAIDLCCIHPDSERLIVVAKGAGYVVSPKTPTQWEEIPLRPILGHRFDEGSNTLVLFDYTRALGIGEKGYAWKTPSLSWDGLTDVEVKNGVLFGNGWDAASSRFVPFQVRLSDGIHSGGASPPRDQLE
ncbi:hypothetical protein [Aquimonas sp.]|jgi:hypothetical protein|uniref:hypothetical protein n=1 Tax=Aquimonas sp. TaxID=1872588 RepID=UPI0037C013B9